MGCNIALRGHGEDETPSRESRILRSMSTNVIRLLTVLPNSITSCGNQVCIVCHTTFFSCWIRNSNWILEIDHRRGYVNPISGDCVRWKLAVPGSNSINIVILGSIISVTFQVVTKPPPRIDTYRKLSRAHTRKSKFCSWAFAKAKIRDARNFVSGQGFFYYRLVTAGGKTGTRLPSFILTLSPCVYVSALLRVTCIYFFLVRVPIPEVVFWQSKFFAPTHTQQRRDMCQGDMPKARHVLLLVQIFPVSRLWNLSTE